MTSVHKLKLYPIGDKEEINRVYKFIRDGQYAQYQGLNLLMGQLASKYYELNKDFKCQEFVEFKKKCLTNSNPILKDIQFSTGVDTLSAITQRVGKDFKIALENGLAKGERTITNYKRTFPLITRGRDLKFYADDETDLEKIITDKSVKVYLKWVNKIVFEVILGRVHSDNEQRCTIKKIIQGDLSVVQSSITIKDKTIILNLSTSTPKDVIEDVPNITLDENVVVGVDLGIAIPAVCALNVNDYVKKSIGSKDDFLRVRTKIQGQRRRLQKNLNQTRGGNGRTKKLKNLDKFKAKETHFAQQYNHFVSKQVVDFAIKNNAKYINLEDLTKDGFKNSLLRNWSYYQLQQYIEYKANRVGIVVRKINPYHTSQICSKCGHWEEGQRLDQAHFKCKLCGYEVNADFNGARNIAKSTDFTDKKASKKKKAE